MICLLVRFISQFLFQEVISLPVRFLSHLFHYPQRVIALLVRFMSPFISQPSHIWNTTIDLHAGEIHFLLLFLFHTKTSVRFKSRPSSLHVRPLLNVDLRLSYLLKIAFTEISQTWISFVSQTTAAFSKDSRVLPEANSTTAKLFAF